MISLKEIYLNINNLSIFENLNLSIDKNKKAVISGQSGIGKSTLLNLLLGFVHPDSGLIEINNKLLTASSVKSIRRMIAWLPQNVNILGKGKVASIINEIFNYKINRQVKPSLEKIYHYLESLNLDIKILENDFENLSGGEKQRIGIIICLMLKRPITLLDEPTSALDTETKQKVIEMIFKNEEMTVLACSHDSDWIQHSDYVYKIENKNIISLEVE